MMAQFSQLPDSAASSIKPFTISFPDSDLRNLKDLLHLTPLPLQGYENSLPNGERQLGLRLDWLKEAKNSWENDFDWRETELHLNSFPQYTVPVDDKLGRFEIHFAALFSKKQDAIPIIMLHGWPGNFTEFLGILSLLKKEHTPETLPYHIITPSLPGYTFSKMPEQPTDFSQIDCARIMNTLAIDILGFESYIVQGGDVGSRVARVMGVNHDACKAVHLNFCSISQPPDEKIKGTISDVEKAGLKRWEHWKATGTAYAMEHATKPATIGAVLASNPVALLAWIGEKFLDWTDRDPSIQNILEHVTLYWLTKCMHTNLWSYRHSYGPDAKPPDHPDWYLHKPLALGYSYFPKELIPIPVAWVATTGNLVQSNVHQSGGHFAAMEEPEALWKDVDGFVKQVSK